MEYCRWITLVFSTAEVGLQIHDFVNAIVIEWELVEGASGYEVNIKSQYREGNRLIESKYIERSRNQNYTVIKGKFITSLSLSLSLSL